MSDSTHLRHDHRHRLRHGAHRSRGGLAGALMPSVLAVAAVAALITALAVWQGEELEQPRASAASETRDAAGPAEQRPAQKSTQEPPASSPPETSGPATSPAQTATSEPERSPDEVSDLEVVVLNQTSRSGLAGSVADRLRASGWEVPAVGNFRGIVPATTVYYPAGAEADALAVARDLPTEPRVRPRFGNLSTTRLTVVVTDSYPG
jgi:hypothetical protein